MICVGAIRPGVPRAMPLPSRHRPGRAGRAAAWSRTGTARGAPSACRPARSRRHRLHEAVGRDHRDLARLHVGLVDHAAHAAVMVDVAVRVDHRHHRLLRAMREIVRERRARDLGGGQRIDQDQAGVALDHRHVGDVEAAQLIEPVGDLEQAVGQVEPRHAPQAGIDRGRRQLAVDEGVLAQVPQHRAAGRRAPCPRAPARSGRAWPRRSRRPRRTAAWPPSPRWPPWSRARHRARRRDARPEPERLKLPPCLFPFSLSPRGTLRFEP